MHKYCQDRTRLVKNMQKPELSPAARLSHRALPGQRRLARAGTGSSPHFFMSPGQGLGLASTQASLLQAFLNHEDPKLRAWFQSTQPFSCTITVAVVTGACLFSCEVTSPAGSCCCSPAKRREQEQHSGERQGRWKEGVTVRLCLPTQGHLFSSG